MFNTVQPSGIEVALRAWEQMCNDQSHRRKALELALDKARYEAQRARRQYDAVEPENRLVATELEVRWNAALAQVSEAERRLHDSDTSIHSLADSQRTRLLELGADLQAAWKHRMAPVALKKRILRTVINEIVVDVDKPKQELVFRVHWAGGVHSTLRVHKNRTGQHQRTTDRDVVELVRELSQVCGDQSIASILNRLGYETGAGNSWTESRVCHLRSYHHIAAFDKRGPRLWITLAEAAGELKVSPARVRRLIESKILPARQVVRHAPWVIKREDLHRAEVQACFRHGSVRKKLPQHEDSQSIMPFV